MSSIITTSLQTFLERDYDIIIIGGGTAGLALASRLSEVPALTIGVIEAGPDKSEDPRCYHWGFKSTVQENLLDPSAADGNGKERVLTLPRYDLVSMSSSTNDTNAFYFLSGKLLGGTSGINSMEWMKTESFTPQTTVSFPDLDKNALKDINGFEGPVKTSQNWYPLTVLPPLITIVRKPLGLQNMKRSIDPSDSTRYYSVSSYLRKAKEAKRENLSVLIGAVVSRIVLEDGGDGDLVAKRVEFVISESGEKAEVRAAKGVVVCTGAYQTPQILELSGMLHPCSLSSLTPGLGKQHKLPRLQ
ncbi:GMC oxidoreductase [Sphaerobolus stellatus SS14]|uniref:GMC oxidoreductase n=1 Tax=Sphaerobolus stellatus (strain SS14) TaxID=990650 RepID=A0A0C9UME1_SPHS4|nr:GMC oxidoreductase [Sphaerobolus stellatus SS14]